MRSVCAIVLVLGSAAGADPLPKQPPPPPVKLSPPAPEVRPTKLDLPALPTFELPPSEPGLHDPRELLVAGRKLLGSELDVKGYVTWIYDCVAAVGKPKQSRAEVERMIGEDPTLCERPKLYLGTAKDTPPERSLWVVDVPRPPNKLEKQRLPRAELAKWPAVPRVAVGDLVVVTGKLELRSPHGEANSDGLVVYQKLVPGKPAAPPPAAAWTKPPPRPAVPPPVIAKRAPGPADRALQTASILHSNAGAKAYGQRQHAAAIAEYRQAIAAWPDNHIAHYGLAGALAAGRDWRAARDAAAQAAAIAPGEAMYQMIHGIAQYEAAIQTAREDLAKAQNRKPEEVALDRSAIAQDGALASLAQAARLNDQLWRAHYYLGRIYRDRGDARWAAEELHAALRSGPTEPAPWIALVELCRGWGYSDHAIAFSRLGLTAVPGAAEGADLWYTLGMAYEDKHQGKEAIDAFSSALAARADHHKAKFQRGQVYFRLRDRAKAKADLEEFLASPEAEPFARAAATRMLMDLAAKQP